MIELDKVKCAKEFMDMLADGVDPTSGQVLPNDTILNNVNLSRCFNFTSDILTNVIENNGFTGRRKSNQYKLAPFALTDELRNQIEITEAPVMIKHLTGRINSLVDDSVMRQLKVTALTSWLVNNGYLSEETINDRKRKKPTKAGEEIGISSEFREGHYGSYLAILYSESAQRHLVSNLEQIIAFSNGDQ